MRDATNHDPLEVIGNENIETGWFELNGQVATSTSTTIASPAIYGVLVERVGPGTGADLPFEICLQSGHLLPRGIGGDNEDSLPNNDDCSVSIPRRQPGSLLLYPEFNNRIGADTVFTVTNVNKTGPVRVHFVYYGRYGS